MADSFAANPTVSELSEKKANPKAASSWGLITALPAGSVRSYVRVHQLKVKHLAAGRTVRSRY
ncbi:MULTISPECIES: hypothetical protein [Stenotrophomonas]|uniref:hypothetical protein n=1 Tax=Stenotrophomonas TaxID=40323 RepID=UPI00114CAB39|nr:MULTISPECIES: hypothetical protein [Stenotrophomonas]